MALMMPGSSTAVVRRAAGLGAIALLQMYWLLQPGPVTLKVVTASIALASITDPAAGLLIFAGLAPLSTVIATLCGASGFGAELLEQMALGVGAGALLRGGPPEGRTRIGAPAVLMAIVAVASAAAMVPATAAPLARSLSPGMLLQQFADRQWAQFSPEWSPLFAAVTVVECALLGWAAERTVRRTPQLAARLVAIALIGHAGAALMNLQTVLGGAVRTGDVLHAMPSLLMTVRVSMQTDWNAAASGLLLAGVAGIGLMTGTRGRKAGISLLLVLVAIGVWITGSRIAMAMAVGAAAIGWTAAQAGTRVRLRVAGVAILTLAIGSWLVTHNPSGRNDPIARSVHIRQVMFKAGVEMFKEAPVFGIGIAKFYDASASYVGPTLTSMGWGPRENAHNNFMQVLAEEGLVGFAVLLSWLGVVLVESARAQISKPNPLRGGLLLGIVAAVGTWLTGHPLLVHEFAFVFWLYCGILTAVTPMRPPTRSRWIPWALAAGIVLSVPARANALRNVAVLEHRGFGLSLWQHDDQQRYREAGTSFALFLPATGQPVAVPVRRAPGAPDPLIIDVRIGDRLANSVSIGGEDWQSITVVLPRSSRRFEPVDFVVRPAASSTPVPSVLLRVGRALSSYRPIS